MELGTEVAVFSEFFFREDNQTKRGVLQETYFVVMATKRLQPRLHFYREKLGQSLDQTWRM